MGKSVYKKYEKDGKILRIIPPKRNASGWVRYPYELMQPIYTTETGGLAPTNLSKYTSEPIERTPHDYVTIYGDTNIDSLALMRGLKDNPFDV